MFRICGNEIRPCKCSLLGVGWIQTFNFGFRNISQLIYPNDYVWNYESETKLLNTCIGFCENHNKCSMWACKSCCYPHNPEMGLKLNIIKRCLITKTQQKAGEKAVKVLLLILGFSITVLQTIYNDNSV